MPTYQIVTGITVQKQLVNVPARFIPGEEYCVEDEENCCSTTPDTPVDHGGGSAPPPASNACCNDLSIPGTLYVTSSLGTGNAAQFEGFSVPAVWNGVAWNFDGDFGGNSISVVIQCNNLVNCPATEYSVIFTGGLCSVIECGTPTDCSPFLMVVDLTIITFPDCSGTLRLTITE